jgi:hypothetical protein
MRRNIKTLFKEPMQKWRPTPDGCVARRSAVLIYHV